MADNVVSSHFRQAPLKLTPDSLPGHLEQHLLPAYLVSGDEPLLAGEAADAIRARARAVGFSEREVHFLERGSDWDDVRASAGNMSLFGSRRLLELRLPTGRPGVAGNNALLALLERKDPDTLLLVLAPRLDRDAQAAQWFRALEAHGGWIPVWPVEANRLVGWLRGRCRRLHLEIAEEALVLLAERTEGNLLAAHQELEKLRLLAPAGAITADTVLAGVADSARFDVFRLSEAVLEGEADRALRVLAACGPRGRSRRWCSGPSPRRCGTSGARSRVRARAARAAAGSGKQRLWTRRYGARRACRSGRSRCAPPVPTA